VQVSSVLITLESPRHESRLAKYLGGCGDPDYDMMFTLSILVYLVTKAGCRVPRSSEA
jgi:hypothetical protein